MPSTRSDMPDTWTSQERLNCTCLYTGTQRPALGSGYLPTCATHLAPLVPGTRLQVLNWQQLARGLKRHGTCFQPLGCALLPPSIEAASALHLHLHLHTHLDEASVTKDLPGAGLSFTYGCHRHLLRLGQTLQVRTIHPPTKTKGVKEQKSEKVGSRIQQVQGSPSATSWIARPLAFACCSLTRVTCTTANCHVQPPAK